MPSYATSSVDGLAVFYELLSLEEASAEERAADEQYRELGPDFAAHLTAQLEIVHATYAAGLAWGTAYSARAPHGEFGTHVLDGLNKLSYQKFQVARESGWADVRAPEPDQARPIQLRPLSVAYSCSQA